MSRFRVADSVARPSVRGLARKDRFFPFDPIDMTKVAILVDRYMNDVRPLGEHSPIVLPDQDSETVVVVVDGVGSSTADPQLRHVMDKLEASGLQVCFFSYLGLGTEYYQPKDTARANFDDLVQRLNEYVEYYSGASSLILVGYSFGGLIISEWLHRKERLVRDVENFRGVVLLASPIRLQAHRVFYRKEYLQFAEARQQVDRLLTGYSALPEHVPLITSMITIWCENDSLLPTEAYSFRKDRPLDDQPLEHSVPYNHYDAPEQEDVQDLVVSSVTVLHGRSRSS